LHLLPNRREKAFGRREIEHGWQRQRRVGTLICVGHRLLAFP
jgi:hypothetical protein